MLLGMFVIFQSSNGCLHSTCDLVRLRDDDRRDCDDDDDDVIGFAK